MPLERARDFTERAIELGVVTRERVEEARRRQARLREEGRRAFLAEVLIELCALTPRRLVQILDDCRGYREESADASPRVGDAAVGKGYVCAEDLYQCLRTQRDEDAAGLPHRTLGEILLDRGLVTPWELEDVLVALAEHQFGSSRSGDTPSGAIPLARTCDGGTATRRARTGTRRAPRRVVEAGALVGELMSPAVTVDVDARAGEALEAAWDDGAHQVLVTSRSTLVGVLDAFELQEVDPRVFVSELVVSDAVLTIGPRARITDALRILRWSGVSCLPVVAAGRVVGVLTRGDLRRAGLAPIEEALPDEELGCGD